MYNSRLQNQHTLAKDVSAILPPMVSEGQGGAQGGGCEGLSVVGSSLELCGSMLFKTLLYITPFVFLC